MACHNPKGYCDQRGCEVWGCPFNKDDMVRTSEFWAGAFGNEYISRNNIDYRTRMDFFLDVMDITDAETILEVGCNKGHNLQALAAVDSDVELAGCDINATAATMAESAMPEAFILNVGANELDQFGIKFDLVFTAGVLIHVGPESLKAVMQAIIDASEKYVLAVEYDADIEMEVEYRGHAGKLWRRPFGKLYEDMGLKLVKSWPAGDGFDNCQAWLMVKP